MDDDLVVRDDLVIPAAELAWRFSTSGGPGGQHANKAATRAELTWDLAASDVVDDDVRARLQQALGNRVVGGAVTVAADDSRSQWRNRAIARRRLAELLTEALRPRRRRRRTRPTLASRRRRLESKRHLAEKKRLRRPPQPGDG